MKPNGNRPNSKRVLVSQKAVFLDRDGIINKPIVREGKTYPPQTMEQFEFLDGLKPTLNHLKQAGYTLIIFTNQPDVARGTQTMKQLQQFHDHISKELPIDHIYACIHDDNDDCQCRKPKPGMLHQAQKEYGIDLKQSYAVGDRWKDIEAGAQAGCTTIFLDYGYQESIRTPPDHTIQSIQELTNIIPINQPKPELGDAL